MNTTAMIVVSPVTVQPKPLTHSQMARRCERVARRLQKQEWDRSMEDKAWSVAETLMDAAVCFMAAAEKGNKRAARDAADGVRSFARAVKMAGSDVGIDAVKMLGMTSV